MKELEIKSCAAFKITSVKFRLPFLPSIFHELLGGFPSRETGNWLVSSKIGGVT